MEGDRNIVVGLVISIASDVWYVKVTGFSVDCLDYGGDKTSRGLGCHRLACNLTWTLEVFKALPYLISRVSRMAGSFTLFYVEYIQKLMLLFTSVSIF